MLVISLAYVLDLIFGDPVWFPHPVKIIGWIIVRLEKLLRNVFTSARTGGVMLALLVSGGTYLSVFLLVRFAFSIHYYFGFCVSAFLIYTTLSVKGLANEAGIVLKQLGKPNLDSARRQLSKMVGRDTHNLGKEEIARATIESVAENTSDGVIAPLFYAFIGGVPLAFAYKAINTLDSMIGYKNQSYKEFGWASAKLDDIANFIPARISGALILLAALAFKRDWRSSLKILFRDGRKHPSPNSGIPEAAVAGALGIQLGGISYYGGIISHKPFIGEPKECLQSWHIKGAISLMHIASVLMLVFCIAVFSCVAVGERYCLKLLYYHL